MTAFVESCVQTVAGSAVVADRHARGKPRARKLLKLLADKKNILVTTHVHPDPDALGSAMALCHLFRLKLNGANISMSVKGQIGGGLNEAFIKYADLHITPWSDAKLPKYDAIVLLDCQPGFAYSPLPVGLMPTAVIDHHRSKRRLPRCGFCDIRTDVGASASIVFSYFMEVEVSIPADLGATLLYAIESDLAGAAGEPSSLDNVALSSLTLIANTHKLYQMRYVDLPQSYYRAYAQGLTNATVYDNVITTFIGEIDSLEKPAVIADFLLRYDEVIWALVSAIHNDKLLLSLRTSDPKLSAGEIMRRLVNKIGEGGGHRAKAGGYVVLTNGSAAEIERVRALVRRRLLRSLKIAASRGAKLV